MHPPIVQPAPMYAPRLPGNGVGSPMADGGVPAGQPTISPMQGGQTLGVQPGATQQVANALLRGKGFNGLNPIPFNPHVNQSY